MLTGTIRNEIDKLWETFWTGGISNPLTVIEQITYLLFLRRLDEQQTLKEKRANMLKVPVKDPFYEKEESALRWGSFKQLDPEKMYGLFQRPTVKDMTVFDKMKAVGRGGGMFKQFMRGATFMIPTPKLLDSAVQMIDQIDMRDRDTRGDLYEYLLSKIATSGQNGQFRTPHHIIKMMVDMMRPTPQDTICDPAAGTMGFQVGACDYLHDQHEDAFHDRTFLDHFKSGIFTGIEFDTSMMRIGAMNLMLHGIETPTLIMKDSLSQANSDINDRFSLILANPPFKGSLDYEAVDPAILSVVRSKKTELDGTCLVLRYAGRWIQPG